MSQQPKFAANIPVWLRQWAQSIDTLSPFDAAAKTCKALRLRPQLNRLLLSVEVCAQIDAADRTDLPDLKAVPAQIDESDPEEVTARARERRGAMHEFLIDASLLAVDLRLEPMSASETKKKLRNLAIRCRNFGKSLRIAALFSPPTKIDQLASLYREREERRRKRRDEVAEIIAKYRGRGGSIDIESKREGKSEAQPPALALGFDAGFDLREALVLYAELLDEAAEQPVNRRRATGKYSKRNDLLDLLIVTALRKYFRKLPNSLLAAMVEALTEKPVSESGFRARAARLRK